MDPASVSINLRMFLIPSFVSGGRYLAFSMAEVTVPPREMFAGVLSLIARLLVPHQHEVLAGYMVRNTRQEACIQMR